MTKDEIRLKLIEFKRGALYDLDEKLTENELLNKMYDMHTWNIDRELEKEEVNWGYIASLAMDLDYLQGIQKELNDIIDEV